MQTRKNIVSRVSDGAGDLLETVQTRLEMLSVELQRERDAIVLQLKLGMISIIAAGIAVISAVLWVALALDAKSRAIALGVMTVIFVGAALGVAMVGRQQRHHQQQLFANVIAQLRRDRATLRS